MRAGCMALVMAPKRLRTARASAARNRSEVSVDRSMGADGTESAQLSFASRAPRLGQRSGAFVDCASRSSRAASARIQRDNRSERASLASVL